MKLKIVVSILLFSSTFISCNETKNLAKEDTNISGNYKSVGYGRFLKISEGTFKVFDINAFICYPILEGEIADVEDIITYKNDTLTIQDGINRYQYVKMENMPNLCIAGTDAYQKAEKMKNDPIYNFEALWDDFKSHYAYFDLRGVNPDSMYATYRPRITATTTEAELYLVLDEMLATFNDGHISIDAPDAIVEAAQNVREKNLEKAKISEAPKRARLRSYQVSKQVADHYIPDGKSVKNGNLRWDVLKNNVGYLQVNQMMAVADYNLSDTLSYRDYWMAYLAMADESENDNIDEIEGVNTSLDNIMADLKNTDALIIDVRFNGGGKDEVGMEILKRLNAKEFIAFTKKGKLGEAFTPVNAVMQPAGTNVYTKPVYLLTSVESASATEIMTLSSLSMPNITRIGGSTEGVFSDILDRMLPNEWEYGLSSEVYVDNNGVNFESIGIPPDVEVGYARDTQDFLYKVVDDLANDGDVAIKKALQLIKED